MTKSNKCNNVTRREPRRYYLVAISMNRDEQSSDGVAHTQTSSRKVAMRAGPGTLLKAALRSNPIAE